MKLAILSFIQTNNRKRQSFFWVLTILRTGSPFDSKIHQGRMMRSKPTEMQSSWGLGGQPKLCCIDYTYISGFLRDAPSAQLCQARDFCHTMVA